MRLARKGRLCNFDECEKSYGKKKDGENMDPERAQEIINSLGVIEVLHIDTPVWIERADDHWAEVVYLDSDERAEVPLNELIEGD